MEIRRLVTFVFTGLSKHDDKVCVQDFIEACSYGEALNFETLLKIFDANRKKGFLEKLFAPQTIEYLYMTDANAKVQNEYILTTHRYHAYRSFCMVGSILVAVYHLVSDAAGYSCCRLLRSNSHRTCH